MSASSKNVPSNRAEVAHQKEPRCLSIAARGITTSLDFAAMMSALMSDIIEERIEPMQANAVCKAGSSLLKIVEMQIKYGVPISASRPEKVLSLVSDLPA